MQLGFHFFQSRCTGCGACAVACKDWNDVPAGPTKFIRVLYHEQGDVPDVFVSHMVYMCFHCERPPCEAACPAQAITKRPQDGIVIVDAQKCVGRLECGAPCLKACPYDAPQFSIDPNSKMQKCDLCLERWQHGKRPICVEACPTRALEAGPIEELEATYGTLRQPTGFDPLSKALPSIRITPK